MKSKLVGKRVYVVDKESIYFGEWGRLLILMGNFIMSKLRTDLMLCRCLIGSNCMSLDRKCSKRKKNKYQASKPPGCPGGFCLLGYGLVARNACCLPCGRPERPRAHSRQSIAFYLSLIVSESRAFRSPAPLPAVRPPKFFLVNNRKCLLTVRVIPPLFR